MRKLNMVRVKAVGFVGILVLAAFMFGMLTANIQSAGGLLPLLAKADESTALDKLDGYELVEYQVGSGDRFWHVQQDMDSSVSIEEARWLFPYANEGRSAGELKAGETIMLLKKK